VAAAGPHRAHFAKVLAAGLLASVASVGVASAEEITVWWNKGFFQAEDTAIKDVIEAWQKKTGNTVNLSFYSTGDIPAKVVSAITTGQVPDIAYADTADFSIAPQQAWNDKLEDVSDVIEPIKDKYTKTALLSAELYNDAKKKRSYYAVPLKQQALHNFYWRPLVEKAGYKDSDIPTTWDAYFKFWGDVQQKLRNKGMRVYALGFPMSTVDTDNFYTFNQYLLAYGGRLVSPDGKLHVDDPQVKEAAVRALTFITGAYKDGLIPPGAINWGDPDNNSAFFGKQIIMTCNASISIPVAKFEDKQLYQHDIVTQAQPTGPDGKPVTSLVAVKVAMVPKGARHVEAAKDFLRFLTEPDNLGNYLAGARGRWLPVMPEIVKKQPFWTNPDDPHITVAVKQEVDGPTEPWPMAYNPAYAQVNAEEVWGKAEGEVVTNGLTPEVAVEHAFARIKEIFSQYQVASD